MATGCEHFRFLSEKLFYHIYHKKHQWASATHQSFPKLHFILISLLFLCWHVIYTGVVWRTGKITCLCCRLTSRGGANVVADVHFCSFSFSYRLNPIRLMWLGKVKIELYGNWEGGGEVWGSAVHINWGRCQRSFQLQNRSWERIWLIKGVLNNNDFPHSRWNDECTCRLFMQCFVIICLKSMVLNTSYLLCCTNSAYLNKRRSLLPIKSTLA